MNNQKITYYCPVDRKFLTPIKYFDFPHQEHFKNIDWLISLGHIPPAPFCVIWNDSGCYVHITSVYSPKDLNQLDKDIIAAVEHINFLLFGVPV